MKLWKEIKNEIKILGIWGFAIILLGLSKQIIRLFQELFNQKLEFKDGFTAILFYSWKILF